MTPEELLLEAERMTHDVVPGTRGSWPRAAALLGRMALEGAVNARLAALDPEIVHASMRARLLCIGLVVDEDVASGLRSAWAGLSRACHQHSYELAPTAAELNGWFAQTRAIVSTNS